MTAMPTAREHATRWREHSCGGVPTSLWRCAEARRALSMPASTRRRLVHRPWFVAIASALAAAYLRLVARTTRWETEFDPATLAVLGSGRGGIGVFWHQRLLGVPALWHRLARASAIEHTCVAAIVSLHGDGELIARTLDRLGVPPIRGSTNRGGAAVARDAQRRLEGGQSLAVVVDGPRGPHGHVHRGALFLARRTGRPIVPLTYAVSHGLQAGSWDRLLIPLPFGRGRLRAGPPTFVCGDGGEACSASLSADLQRWLLENAAADDEAIGVRRAGAGAPLRDC